MISLFLEQSSRLGLLLEITHSGNPRSMYCPHHCRIYYLCVCEFYLAFRQSACHSFIDAGRRQGAPGLETEDSVTPSTADWMSLMSPSVVFCSPSPTEPSSLRRRCTHSEYMLYPVYQLSA